MAKKSWLIALGYLLLLCTAAVLGRFSHSWFPTTSDHSFWSPLTSAPSASRPLQKYSIPELAHYTGQASPIVVKEILKTDDSTTALLFTFSPLGRQMSGQLTIPTAWLSSPPATASPTIVMLRGYVPVESYSTGVGTKNGAAALAKAGYLTVAPDFFGYGESEAEPADSWQARFEKPLIVLDLLASLNQGTITIPASVNPQQTALTLSVGKMGMWAHSNGGQIALTTLEALGKPLPTTLWAPVTAPFPYSILFFSDEVDDEGKSLRKWLASFEKDYDVFDFTLTKHLDALTGPLQLHHGSADEAALQIWSVEFVQKVELENKRRLKMLAAEAASPSADFVAPLPAIDLEFFSYPGADHNLQPGWATAIARDIEFFNQRLK